MSAALLCVMVAACSRGATTEPEQLHELAVNVTVGVPFDADPGDACPSPLDGYPSVRDSARVTVRDGNGAVLGVSALQSGTAVAATLTDGEIADGKAFCRFTATVADIAEARFYEITVADQPAHVVAAAEVADSWQVDLTFGAAALDPAMLEAEQAAREEAEAAAAREEAEAEERAQSEAAAAQLAADKALVADHIRQWSDAAAAGPVSYIDFWYRHNYQNRAYSKQECISAQYGWMPETITVEHVPHVSSIERSASWKIPDGRLAGQAPEGRTYVVTVDMYEDADGYVIVNGKYDIHITLVDGVAYHFLECDVDY